MEMLKDIWFTFIRRLRANLREPVWMFFSMTQPLVWLLLFTQLFENVSLISDFPANTYLQFFVPGLIVMLAVFGSTYSGFEILGDIYQGIFEKLLVTPVNRCALIMGSAINWAVGLTIQILIVLGIAYLMGARVATGVAGVMLTIIIVTLLGLGFFGFSNALVLVTKKEEPLVITGNLMTMPLMFLSSVMMPSALVPKWLRLAMKFNPVNYAVEAIRPLFLAGYEWSPILTSIIVLTFFASAGIATATLALYKFSD